jgi:hypothetical protein
MNFEIMLRFKITCLYLQLVESQDTEACKMAKMNLENIHAFQNGVAANFRSSCFQTPSLALKLWLQKRGVRGRSRLRENMRLVI